MGVARTIAKNSLFQFIATAATTSATFVVGIVLARYLGAEQYGIYSFMTWFLTLALLAANIGIGEMTKRFVAEAVGQQNNRSRKGIVQLAIMGRGFLSLFVSVLVIVFSGQLANLFNMPTAQVYFIIIGATIFPSAMTSIFINILAGFQKYEYFSYIELAISLLRVGLVITIMVLGFGVRETLLMFAGTMVVGMFLGIFFTNRLEPIRGLFLHSLLEPAVRTEAIKYSLAAMGILGVDYFLWQNAEVLFLGLYRPAVEVGYYNIANRIPSVLVVIIPFVFGQVLLPAVSELFGKGDMEKIKRIYVTAARYLMILSFPLATVGIALAGPVIKLLFGPEYTPAIVLMQIIFIPIALRGLTFANSSIIYGIKEPGYLLKIGAILVCLSIGLNLWLIPDHGAIGAVIATGIPRVIALPIYILFVSKKIRTPWPVSDTIKIALASVVIGAMAFVLQYYVHSPILSICLSIPICIVVFVAVLLSLGVIKTSDLIVLKKVEMQLPSPLRRGFMVLIGVLDKFARHDSDVA